MSTKNYSTLLAKHNISVADEHFSLHATDFPPNERIQRKPSMFEVSVAQDATSSIESKVYYQHEWSYATRYLDSTKDELVFNEGEHP